MSSDRQAVFDYIFSKADEAGYMGLDSSESSKFQDALENDPELKAIAGEQLSRKYIKDTVLNNYSKQRRYITHDDVLEVISGINREDIEGGKKELENGVFYINKNGVKVSCTSASYSEWQTVFKRFGGRNSGEVRFAFLTCGGVGVEESKLNEVKSILSSYGINAFIVKPNEASVDISDYISLQSIVVEQAKLIRVSKPFILLAGISGTGKTRFVRSQAEFSGSFLDSYCLVSVRPDWHEPSDLMGYTSRLTGRAEYVVTDVLLFIVKAWRDIFSKGGTLHGGSISGTSSCLSSMQVFWLCLDEMNLAPVEQYFSDYLSVLETRQWKWDEDKFVYSCDAIFKASTIRSVDSDKLRDDLGLSGVQCDELWQHFLLNGIGLPFNLIVAGTVNMDETTHGFSRKVIDRALTFDFGEFYPNDFDSYFASQSVAKRIAYPIYSGVDAGFAAPACDSRWQETIGFLNAVNSVLRGTPFELAYRALNELLLSVVGFNPSGDDELQSVWDDFLMCKVLPRIEGDVDKLTKYEGSVPVGVLNALNQVCAIRLNDIWGADSRPDLHRENINPAVGDLIIACRSKKKLMWMQERLERSGFTSFWP